jgi:hypothetical protein
VDRLNRRSHTSVVLAGAIAAAAAGGATDPIGLLEVHCLGCHSRHGQTPIRFDTMEGVRRHRGLMRALIEDRTMPPWLPDDEGAALAHRRRLDESTRATLLAALATPETAAAAFAALAPPEPPPFAVDCPDRFGPHPGWTMPAEGGMRLRTFLVEPPEVGPEGVRGVRFSDPRDLAESPVRFVSLASDPDRTLAVLAEAGESGFESMGNVGAKPSGSLGAVSRVRVAFELPAGFAFALSRGSIALETLAEPVGRMRMVDPQLVWIPAEAADGRLVEAIALAPVGLRLEPGERVERTVERSLDEDVDLVGVLVKGGAFLRGVRLEAISSDGRRAVVLSISDWRSALAEPWTFREPVRVSAGGRLELRLDFDNSAANPQQPADPPQRVTAGLPPDHEDATCVVLFAPAATSR